MEKEIRNKAWQLKYCLGLISYAVSERRHPPFFAVKTVLWDTSAICLFAVTKYATFNCAH